MSMTMDVTRSTARQFIADWFGFDFRRVNISGLQRDKEGRCIGIQFRVHSFYRGRYLARRRSASADWELIMLP